MADNRFRALSSCLVIALLLVIVTPQNHNVAEKDANVNVTLHINNDTKTGNETRSKTCVPAHPSPSPQAICKPYVYGEKGVCSSIIGQRLIYGSLSNQRRMKQLLDNFQMAKAYVLSKDDISDKCLKTVEYVYCNHYFKRCDNASSRILPVPVCMEACEVMVQQHCKEEYRRAHKINKAVKESESASRQWYFDLINCTTLPRRNGGTIPECYYPRELEVNINKEDLSDACSYGNGQSYHGNISVTQSGYTCQSWTSQCPHRHERTPDNFPELNNAGNACRNPGGQAPLGPWCYTTNASVRWEYCNISNCHPENATMSDWSPFTTCSASCGAGSKTRYRTCNRPRFGGKTCSALGPLTEKQPCNVHDCNGTVELGPKGTVEKGLKGLTFVEIAIVSGVGSVLLIVVAALAVILFKKHRAGHTPNIPDEADEKEITPYATVRFSSVFPLNVENNDYGFPGMYENPLKTLPFHLRTPLGERAAVRGELRNSPYENIDHFGKSLVNPLEYLFYKPRYENETIDDETRDVVMIRPGYDRLTPATRKKERENGGAKLGRRLPWGMVDTHSLSVYDSLIREIDLRCKSRRGDITDSEGEDNMNIHTILEVPSSDEHSPACSIDRKKNQENSLRDIESESECTGNDLISKTSEVQGGMKPSALKQAIGKPPQRSHAAFKMEDQTGLFEFYSSDRTEDAEQQQTPDENMHVIRPDESSRPSTTPPDSGSFPQDPEKPQSLGLLPLDMEGIRPGLEA